MCNTPWCYGDCEDCVKESKQKQDEEDRECCRFSPGPYVPQNQCGIKAVDTYTDACGKCGFVKKY